MFFSSKPAHETEGESDDAQPIKFVDLFAGVGGASTGAMNAGYQVTLAVDYCPDVLATHEHNHPHTKHMCMALPPNKPLPLPSADERWHLHGSPPCTLLSQANPARTKARANEGLKLVKWYVEFALSSSAETWSMEQVAMPAVLKLLESYRQKPQYRRKLDYAAFWFQKLGVPQKRRRVIAGSPALIAKLRRVRPTYTSVTRVIDAPRGTHVRNGGRWGHPYIDGKPSRYYTDDDMCLPCTGAVYTVTGGNPLRWATPHTGTPLVRLTIDESSLLQCFPKGYEHLGTMKQGLLGVGNAIPPLIIEKMLTEPSRPPSPSLRWRPPVRPRWATV